MEKDKATGTRATKGPTKVPDRPLPRKKGNREELEAFRLIFDSIYNGCMVTDAEGYVTLFNRPYGQFLGIDPEDQIAKPHPIPL